jgi:2-oxoisovalerate dehydrogenase E1 component alpha subunit
MKLQRQGRIGFYIGAYGQEASHVAAGFAFEPRDWIVPAYRQVGIALLRGASPADLIHQLFGNAKDPIRGAQMPCHYSLRSINFASISSPIATQVPHAVGVAMAAKYKGDPVVACTFLGDGGTSEGEFHVGMNFAGVYQAPVVIIIENNQWAISCPANEQTASESFAIKARAYGFEGWLVDGNDPLAVFAATKKAVDKARDGGGPTLIENHTYRLFSHSSSDDAGRYQPREMYEEAVKKDPLIRYRTYLEEREVWSQAWEDGFSERFRDEINAVIREAEETPRPDPSTIFDNVFAERTPALERQWRELEEELKERTSWEEEGEFPL